MLHDYIEILYEAIGLKSIRLGISFFTLFHAFSTQRRSLVRLTRWSQ